MYIFVLLGRFYKHLRNVYRKLPLCHMGFCGPIRCDFLFCIFEELDELDAVRSDLHYPFLGLEMFKAANGKSAKFCFVNVSLHRFAQSLDTIIIIIFCLCWT